MEGKGKPQIRENLLVVERKGKRSKPHTRYRTVAVPLEV
jgi:hypothetical protein